jgi:hypothetical protein
LIDKRNNYFQGELIAMKPIYFPFTYVPNTVAESLSACFGQFIVYRPLEENLSAQLQFWIDRGVADVRVPVSGHEAELKTAIKNYQDWADLHRKGSRETAVILRSHIDRMPFFNELSTRKIVEDIKANIPGDSDTQPPDFFLAARIFLYFAQEFDRQNQELTDDLIHHQLQETELIQRLKMEEDPLAVELQNVPGHLPDLFADYMIPDRLESWTRIFCRDQDLSGLFVTHSTAVLEHLLERTSTATRVVHLKSIPSGKHPNAVRNSWQERLAFNLGRLVEQNPVDISSESMAPLDFPAAGDKVSLSVYRVPDETPYEFFSRCAELDRPPADATDCNDKFRNTLIALVQR